MDKINLLKLIGNGLIGVEITSIVEDIADYFVPAKKQKTLIKMGTGVITFVVSNIITEKVSDYFNKEVNKAYGLEPSEEGA